MNVVRWIAVLPGAVGAGWLAYFVGGFLNNLNIYLAAGSTDHSWFVGIGPEFVNHMFLAAAAVYAAVKIGPTGPKIVASVAATVLVTLALITLCLTLIAGKFGSLPGGFGLIFGAVVVMISALRGEIHPFQLKNKSNLE